MQTVAYSTLAVTLALSLFRPRLGRFRVSPAGAALAGATLLAAAGLLSIADLTLTTRLLARPLATLVGLMLLAGVAERTGVIDGWAALAARASRGLAPRLHLGVFSVAALSSTLLDNDTTVLLFTPAVIATVRRLWPHEPGLLAPFALAVFCAAGLAPLPLSNPMNLVVSEAAGVPFATYVRLMAPSALAGWLVTYAVLRRISARALAAAPVSTTWQAPALASPARRRVTWLIAAVVLAYAPVAALGGPVWLIALAGGVLALTQVPRPRALVADAVAWDTLAFLLGAFLIGHALRHAGLTDQLGSLYARADAHPAVVGSISALGSALINNHPMAVLNLLTLQDLGAGHAALCAALVGGDLGPRLLPIGSLAGLLWLGALARAGVELRLARFVLVGVLVTVPALAAALAVLMATA